MDAAHVYWTTGRPVADGAPSGGAIMRAPLAGGAPEVLVADLRLPSGIEVDAHNAYWFDDFEGRVLSVPLAGGEPVTVTGTGQVRGFAIDTTSVYWLDERPPQPSGVMKAPLSGGTGIALAPAQGKLGGLAVDSSNVYWTELDMPLGTLSLRKVPLTGGSVTTLYSADSTSTDASELAIDATSAYLVSSTPDHGDNLLAIPLAGGTPTALATVGGQVSALAVDTHAVYWSELASGTVKRVSRAGGTPSSFTSLPLVTDISTSGSKVSWTSNEATWAVSTFESCH